MPIKITYQKFDAEGNEYYVDEHGNRIVEDSKPVDVPYFSSKKYQDYLDTLTEEDLAKQRAEGLARWEAKQVGNRVESAPFQLRPLVKPEAVHPRKPLWTSHEGTVYWAEREVCVMVGDTGVGKTLMGLSVAKSICTLPRPLPTSREGSVAPSTSGKKVLYVDFEMDDEMFWERYGENESIENFYWAGFNAHNQLPKDVTSQTDWLLGNLEEQIQSTKAEVLIIDQIDRMQIPIGKRLEFLFKLKALTRKYKLSTMLVINTRARNFSKEVGLQHVYHSRLYVPMADSVIAMAADFNDETTRYLKPLKLRNRPLNHKAELECFSIYPDDNFLSLLFTAMRAEEELLKKSKAKLKEEKMMSAEALRRDGMTYEYIADELVLPISIVKRWTSCVPIKLLPNGTTPLERVERSPAWGEG